MSMVGLTSTVFLLGSVGDKLSFIDCIIFSLELRDCSLMKKLSLFVTVVLYFLWEIQFFCSLYFPEGNTRAR